MLPGTSIEQFNAFVRVVLNGPFALPECSTLVSAIYDISINQELQIPVAIEIEHCVNVVNEQVASKMAFATAEEGKYIFSKIKGGNFTQSCFGSIEINKSCLIAVLYFQNQNEHSLVHSVSM